MFELSFLNLEIPIANRYKGRRNRAKVKGAKSKKGKK